MRRSAVALFAQFIIAAPLAAQFEGTVTARLSEIGGQNAEAVMMKMSLKGNKQSAAITMPAASGPMAGMEMRMIIDPAAGTATSLMPVPPMAAQFPALANAKGIKSVVDLTNANYTGSASDEKMDVKKLGTHEKVAGLDCEDYEITSSSGKSMRACVTEALGRFVFPSTSGPMGRRGGNVGSVPAWSRAFGGRPGFPLKVWKPDGAVVMEVLTVERGSVPSSLFEIPDGYVDMNTVMRGGRP